MTDQCFLICPIGEEGSEIRRRSDQWSKHVVEPVAIEFEYEIKRADEFPDSGIITNQIIAAILNSPLVIADLTGSNPNVFYELALRHASRKPYIQMMHKGEPLPFDVLGIRTIRYDLSDPDDLDKARVTLRRYFQAIRDGGTVESPVSVAVANQLFSQNDNAIQVFLEKFWKLEENFEAVLKELDSISSDVSSIESDVSSIESSIPTGSQEVSSEVGEDIFRMQRDIQHLREEIASIAKKLER